MGVSKFGFKSCVVATPVYEPISVVETKADQRATPETENMASECLCAKSTVMPLGNSVLPR